MIELQPVSVRHGQATVLKNLSLTMDKPGGYCLPGRNGAGKARLLRSIAGYPTITRGVIRGDGQTVPPLTLAPGVSCAENYAEHLKPPVQRLLKPASEMMKRFQRGPRLLILSAHRIEAIAKTSQTRIVLDRGSLRFFDTLQSVEQRRFKSSTRSAMCKRQRTTCASLAIGLPAICSRAVSWPLREAGGLPGNSSALFAAFFIQMVSRKEGAAEWPLFLRWSNVCWRTTGSASFSPPLRRFSPRLPATLRSAAAASPGCRVHSHQQDAGAWLAD